MVPPFEATSTQNRVIDFPKPLIVPDLRVNDLWHFDKDLPNGLFDSVARHRDITVFPDGKAIVDSTPKYSLGYICTAYALAQENPDYYLTPTEFFLDHFDPPNYGHPDISEEPSNLSIGKYISKMWDVLTYYAPEDSGTFIGSPFPNLKPGERFGESCYWDLGDGIRGLLVEARSDEALGNFNESRRKEELVISVANNLVHQIEVEGRITNGRRTYYEGRSQTPVFIEIVKEMESYFGDKWPNIMEDYLPALVKEYEGWMSGERLVRLEDKTGRVHYLNRHWDENDTPRPESYQEDIETAALAKTADKRIVYRHLRAAAEDGRDFSGRWLEDPERLETIHTTDFIPPELNSYLYKYELEIAKAHKKAGRSKLARDFFEKAQQRKVAIDTFLWNEVEGCYYDYDFMAGRQSRIKSMGTAYPVALGASSEYQAKMVAKVLRNDMLKPGGFISTLIDSGQQWDGDNGWSNDQVKANKALIKAGDYKTAITASYRWLGLNRKILKTSGVLVEKSDVVKLTQGGGGEYSRAQRGFLWTNGADRYLEAFLRKQVVIT